MDQEQEVMAVEAPNRESGGLIASAPWWMISTGIHVVILLAASLVMIEKLMAVEEGEVIVRMAPPPGDVVAEIKRDNGFSRTGIPSDDDVQTPSQDVVIFAPDFEESDHNESDDGEDYGKMKGQDMKALSYLPGDGTGFRGRLNSSNSGVYDTMGPGGGGGGSKRHGGDKGGRFNKKVRGETGATVVTENAVLAALKWLARHQSPDGSWSSAGYHKNCVGAKCTGVGSDSYDVGVTGLSLLAFLGAGYTHMSKDEIPDATTGRVHKFGSVVKAGLLWLASRQVPDGCIGEKGPQFMYNHAIASLALCEAYGMTGNTILSDPAQKSIDFLVMAQNPGKGWRYTVKSGDNDTSVTGWAVMALKSAEMADLKLPRSSYEGALAWFDEVTEQGGYSEAGYTHRGSGPVHNAVNQAWSHHPSMSAVAVMSRMFIQKNRSDKNLTAAQLLVQDLPAWKTHQIDYYYWYYTSLALFQYDGPNGPMWTKWNEPMKNALVPNQKLARDGCLNGSWGSEEDRWGSEGGRVYATAINALTLEVYYRYASVFVGNKK